MILREFILFVWEYFHFAMEEKGNDFLQVIWTLSEYVTFKFLTPLAYIVGICVYLYPWKWLYNQCRMWIVACVHVCVNVFCWICFLIISPENCKFCVRMVLSLRRRRSLGPQSYAHEKLPISYQICNPRFDALLNAVENQWWQLNCHGICRLSSILLWYVGYKEPCRSFTCAS